VPIIALQAVYNLNYYVDIYNSYILVVRGLEVGIFDCECDSDPDPDLKSTQEIEIFYDGR
jgi:hypothetical protein